ncbi:hypothetical protein CIL03_05940 [Virgibacillus indicus]|uniref:DUF4367 domain-containing protein n=1 Tax=Virgibacillus indicus TaxID=2024554 RepID=A0A265NBQ5_9BACI|nr:hypothetical protein [Virgibacillus indicus]OZU89257.1 hypothetical protein CIL03_05940 [Virgibacillus indicus]
MNNQDLDKRLEKKFKEHTSPAPKLKDETWNKISKELFPSKSRKGKKFKRVTAGIAAAVIVAFLFFDMTETGQAMIQSLKDMFVEEKDQEIEIEGQKEDAEVHLETNDELRYIIYIDESRYRMKKGDTSDRIVPKDDLPENIPEVSMEIMRKEDTTIEEQLAMIKEEIESNGLTVNREEIIDTPINGIVVKGIGPEYTNEHGKTGHQFDTPIHRYHLTEEEDGQLFVIKQKYFLGAAEGHGARFYYMLESLEIVK